MRPAGCPANGSSVLVVDQFEELFTACEDEQERGEFVAGLVRAARDRSLVVLAVRADFYGRCAAYPELSRLVGANHVLVGPMSRDELRRAIERPAQRVGLSIEPELVESLLTDVEGEPGTLPLLSTALLELWRERDGRRLRHAAYARSGGVQGAVARMAEAAFVGLDPHEQAIARTLLLRLADEGENGTIVRRRIGLAELESAGSPEAAAVVARLTDHRLLTVSDGAIEVAHEALLREWPRLRAWLDEDADSRRLHHQLGDAARAWDADARDPGALYRGARLASALDWAADHDPELNATERAFLDASRTASGRAQRRLRLVLGAVSLLLVAAVIAGLVAVEQRGNARSSERTTEAQALDVQALTEPALDRSLLLARQAVSVVDSPATRSDLLAALLRSPAAIGVLRTDGDPLLSLALSPDGHTLAVAENDGVVRFVDAATLRPVGRPYDAGKARIPELGYSTDSELAYSPDGTRLAVADVTDAYGGFIDLLDGRTHRRIRRLDNGSASGGPSPSPKDVMFSPDSRRLIAHSTSDTASGHGPGHLVVRDARTGRVLKRQNVGNDLGVIGFVAGGRRLLTSSQSTRTTVLRDAENLRPLRSFHVAGRAGASTVTPDGRLAALGAADGSVRLLDLRSGRVRTASGRHDGPVSDARFTPDGRTLVTAGEDTRVMLWNVAEARVSETLEGHAGPIRDVAVSPDGKTAYSASLDGSVIAWDLAGTRRLGRPFHIAPVDPGGPVSNWTGGGSATTPDDRNLPPSVVAATPDGGAFAIPGSDGNVDLYNSSTLARTAVLPVNPGARVFSVAIAPDGRTMAATTAFGEVSFWDLHSRRPLGPPQTAHVGAVWTPTFSRDGHWMATTGQDRIVELWDVRRRRPVKKLYQGLFVDDVGLSPDGKTLAVTTGAEHGQGSVEIYSVPRLTRTTELRAPWGRWGRFSPDGRVLVVADHDGRFRLFDTKTWKPRTRPVLAHPGEILSANISPDSRTLATTSLHDSTRLWDLATGRPIGDGLPGPSQRRSAAIFARHGTHLVTVYDDGRGLVWDLRPSSWTKQACSVARRTLTRDEWDNAMPGRNYDPACREH